MIKSKKSVTSFDVAAIVSEFNENIRGLRLHNIYRYGENGFLFRFKSHGKDLRIVLVPGERAHITRYDVAEKTMPPPLIMGLRKYLRNTVLENVKQLGFDRIIILEFSSRTTRFSIVVELLPRGILALLDASNKVIYASSILKLRDREIRPGLTYTPPPSTVVHPAELGKEDLEKILSADKCDPVRSLVRGLGYPGEAVEEALARLGLSPRKASCSDVRGLAADLVNVFRELYEEALSHRGYMVLNNGRAITVTPFEPRGLAKEYSLEFKEYSSFSNALDEYFVEFLRLSEEAEQASSVERERAKLLASIERARRSLAELGSKIERLEKLAQLIGENMPSLYSAIECARRVRSESGWDYILGNCPGIVDVKPSEGKVLVNLGDEIVELDIRSDPSQVIVNLYKRIGELRAKIERGQKALRELEEKLQELEKRQRIARARARARIRKREWYEKYHWLVTSHGYLAIGGRDASQNESIVKRYLTDKRIFMHADIHGAPAVVLFNEGEEPPEEDLREAALLTAAYSKAWKTGIASIDVYWAWGSQVSKSPPPGEYISKGAFMVYGRRNYLRGIELKLAIGVSVEEEYPLVIVGPERLVKRRSLVYVILIPGDEDPSSLAKRIKKTLHNRFDEYSEVISSLSVDEIRERIPGRSRLLGIHRGDAIEHPRPIKKIHGEEVSES